MKGGVSTNKPERKMQIMESMLRIMIVAAMFPASFASARDLDYATVAALSCRDFLEAYGTDLFYSLSQPIVTYVTEKDSKDRFGSAATIGHYVAIECRLHENYMIGAAVNDLFDQNRRRSLPALPIGDAAQDPGVQAQWDAFDTWIHPRDLAHNSNSGELKLGQGR